MKIIPPKDFLQPEDIKQMIDNIIMYNFELATAGRLVTGDGVGKEMC